MHGTFEQPRETRDNKSVYRNKSIAFLALPVLMAIAVIGLAIVNPSVSVWISQAAQAEFGGSVVMPDAAPTQLARPASDLGNAKAN